MNIPPGYRAMPVLEDAAEGGVLLVPIHESWPDWHCEECNTLNDGLHLNCCYCGSWREDVDSCLSNG